MEIRRALVSRQNAEPVPRKSQYESLIVTGRIFRNQKIVGIALVADTPPELRFELTKDNKHLPPGVRRALKLGYKAGIDDQDRVVIFRRI